MALRSHLEQEADTRDIKVFNFYDLLCISMNIKYLLFLLIALDWTRFNWHLLSIQRKIHVWRYLNDAICYIMSFHNCDSSFRVFFTSTPADILLSLLFLVIWIKSILCTDIQPWFDDMLTFGYKDYAVVTSDSWSSKKYGKMIFAQVQ